MLAWQEEMLRAWIALAQVWACIAVACVCVFLLWPLLAVPFMLGALWLLGRTARRAVRAVRVARAGWRAQREEWTPRP